jgi:hypothetical protein
MLMSIVNADTRVVIHTAEDQDSGTLEAALGVSMSRSVNHCKKSNFKKRERRHGYSDPLVWNRMGPHSILEIQPGGAS